MHRFDATAIASGGRFTGRSGFDPFQPATRKPIDEDINQ